MKLVLMIVISMLILPAAAEEKPQPNCECSCPTLRQHTWETVKLAWQRGQRISQEQWQTFLRWRERQNAQQQGQSGASQRE